MLGDGGFKELHAGGVDLEDEGIAILINDEARERVPFCVDEAAAGFGSKVGALDGFARDVAVIRAARALIDRTDPTVKLVADANQGYCTAEQAIPHHSSDRRAAGLARTALSRRRQAGLPEDQGGLRYQADGG